MSSPMPRAQRTAHVEQTPGGHCQPHHHSLWSHKIKASVEVSVVQV